MDERRQQRRPDRTVRLSDPGSLAAGLPQLIGFTPHESVVLISLTGRTGRQVGMTARVDIPAAENTALLARWLTDRIATDDPEGVIVAVVSEAADDAFGDELPHYDLVRALAGELDEAGIEVRLALLVRGGRWWFYDDVRWGCGPSAGTELPGGVSELAVASIAHGAVVEPDRAGLERRIAPIGWVAAAGMAQACAGVGAAYAERLAVAGWDDLVEESWAAILDAAHCCRPGAGARRLTDTEVARVVWGLRETSVRDRAMSLALGTEPEAAETLWTECTRRAPVPLDAAPATLLALGAWVRGNGAMANIALDRALDSEPGYYLAGLLRQALDAALPPAEVRAMIAATQDDLDAARPAC